MTASEREARILALKEEIRQIEESAENYRSISVSSSDDDYSSMKGQYYSDMAIGFWQLGQQKTKELEQLVAEAEERKEQ